MEKSVSTLPEGYGEVFQLDLQKDKKTAFIVNGLAVALMVVLFAVGCLIVPFSALFTEAEELAPFLVKIVVMLVGLVVYMVLHELVHGVTMKRFGAEKVKYGFTGLYAFAGSETYFAKGPYIVIALAPIAVWGVALFVLCCLVPTDWFWIVYFIQIANLSGAAGDLYVTVRFAKLPPDILVRDTGVAMTVYAPSDAAQGGAAD